MSFQMMNKKLQIRAEDSDDSDEENEMIKVQENRVHFHAPVNRENCFKLIECLRKAQEYVAVQHIKSEFDEIGRIYLYIFSDGGEVHAAFNVADFIQKSKIDIVTINEGCVASAGTVVSLSGKERYIRENAYMLIHEIRSGCIGKYSECQDDMKNNDIMMEHMITFMNKRCQNEKLAKKLDSVLKRDLLWNAKKCLKYGLVDKIV